MSISERVKKLRKTLGLSQTEFGERIGVTIGVIRNLEHDLVPPKELLLNQICKEYHVNPDWLLKGEGDMMLGDTELLFDELSKDFELDELDRKIIQTYLELDHEKRLVLKEFLKKLLE